MKTLHCDKTSPTYKNTPPHTKTHPRYRGPSKRLSKRKPTDNASWGGAPAKRNAKRISTDNKLGWTQQSEVHFNVIESTGIPANQKVLYIKEAQRGFLISNHLCAIILNLCLILFIDCKSSLKQCKNIN